MLPRTTQQSHRPRVSDRTMVGALPPTLACWRFASAVKNANAYGSRPRSALSRQTPAPGPSTIAHTGAGCQRTPPACAVGEKCSLDIPFYRTLSDRYAFLSLPKNLIEYRSEAFALYRIDHLYKGNTALEVCPKLGMSSAVLSFRAVSYTVAESSFQAIEVRPHDVGMMVGDEASQMLANTLPHHPGLSEVNVESLFDQDCRNMRGEAVDTPLEFFIPGEGNVVRVARVRRSY